MDCGPTCLRMVAKHYGRNLSAQELREAAEIGKDGVNLLGIAQAAERVGFKSLGVKVSLEKLKKEAPLPCIVHWGQNHFIVVYKISKSQVFVADPAKGLLKYSFQEFESQWATTVIDGERTGVALLLEPTAAFYENDTFAEKNKEKSFGALFQYFFKYKSLIVQLGLGLLVGSMIQLIMPFLTQSVVDTGIQTRNLNFIYLVLAAQLMLFIGRMAVDFLRSWILLHVSTRINLSILSEFLGKLLKLPVSYFESKQTGDILQRIGDHSRIESFLTGTSLNVLFSLIKRAH
jgi:ATP-binding cassette subfamily B protein